MTVDNEIIVNFGTRHSVIASSRFKGDKGQILKFNDIELPEAYQVHFSNSVTGKSKIAIGNADGVEIYNEYFETGEDIWAWVYIQDTLTSARTKYVVHIPIKDRAEITDEEPTPEEQSAIDQAIAALNHAVEQTAEDVESADAAASNAESAAQRAEAAAEGVEDYAVRAETAAQAAEASEQNAATSEANAAGSATGAAQSASQAAGSATAAAGSATAAQAALDEFTSVTATATTLPEGSQATAHYDSGLLTFGIPTGATGAKGDKGDKGDPGDPGEAIDELKSAINELDSQINGVPVLTPEIVPLSDFSIESWNIIPGDGKWRAQNNSGFYIALSDIERIAITGNATYITQYAFLSSFAPEAGQLAPIVGAAVPSSIELGETVDVTVPSGANYLYIQRVNGNGKRTDPTEVIFYKYVAPDNSIVGEISDLQSDMSNKVDKISGKGLSTNDYTNEEKELVALVPGIDETVNGSIVLTPIEINLANYTREPWYISPSNGSWQSANDRGYFIDLNSAKNVSLTGSASYGTEIAFLSSFTPVSGESAPIVGATLPTKVNAGESVDLTVPEGASYLYIRSIDGNGHATNPTNIYFYCEVREGGIVNDVEQAKADASEAKNTVAVIEPSMPFVYAFERKTINASGVISNSPYNLLSDITSAKAGMTFEISQPYAFRVFLYQDDGETIRGISNWVNTYTVANDGLLRVHIHNHVWQYDYIYPEDVSDGQITTNILFDKNYVSVASKASLSKYVQYDQFNLNLPFVGKEDMMWTWWSYPQIISFKRVRDKLYWTYTTHAGYTGVASYDFDTREVVKCHLKKSLPDDHNNATVFVQEDGTVLVAYTEGHYSNHRLYIRRSKAPESVEDFEDAIPIDTIDYVTYARIFEHNGVLYLFTRSYVKNWTYMTSADGGLTWSAETKLITADMQYYVLVTPTTDSNVLRLVMYSNPNEVDPNIRLGFFHFDNGGIYQSDNTTLLGTNSVPATSFNIIVPVEADKTQRLLDCAVTAPSVTKVLYCPFTEQADDTPEEEYVFDAVYKVYNNGNTLTVCNAGYTTWKQRYQNGASFIDSDTVVVGRSDGTYDYIETYDISNGSVALDEEIKKEAIGTIPIRNARPIVDVNGKALMWWRGYYNHDNYHDFDTDAQIHLLI